MSRTKKIILAEAMLIAALCCAVFFLPKPATIYPNQDVVVGWGASGAGQLGNAGSRVASAGIPVLSDAAWRALEPGTLAQIMLRIPFLPEDFRKSLATPYKVLQLALSAQAGCLLRSDHTVWCWGNLHADHKGTVLKRINNLGGIESMKVIGQYQICAIDGSNNRWCTNPMEQSLRFMPDSGEDRNNSRFSINDASCQLNGDEGTVMCMAGTETEFHPVLTFSGSPLKDIVKVHAGKSMGCGLDKYQSLWCWKGRRGNPGVDDRANYASQVMAPDGEHFLEHVRDFEIGDGSAMAVISSENPDNYIIAPTDNNVAFTLAVQAGRFDEAKAIYGNKAEIANLGRLTEQALYTAVVMNRADFVKILIDTGVSLDASGLDREAPLWAAANNSRKVDPQIVEMLLDHGASVDSGTSGFNLKKMLIAKYKTNPDARRMISQLNGIETDVAPVQ